MRITLIQDSIFWANKSANLMALESKLKSLHGKTDLVVLPEMFSTGFCTDKPELAEPMNGETITKLQLWAKTYNTAIAGSFIATENERYFNRGFFVFPDGKIETADKRHLFSIGGEDKHFESGSKKLLINYMGFSILLLICYDVRFPVWSRNVDNAYDLLIYVANFPEKRIYNWDVLLKARAIENQCFVCGVNCIGTDGMGISYNGHSVLLDYLATPLVVCAENKSASPTYEINTELLKKFRTKSPFWRSADNFLLNK